MRGDFIIVGSGPSLTDADCKIVREYREFRPSARVIVTNLTYRNCPWADICYMADYALVKNHRELMKRSFAGLLMTGHRDAAAEDNTVGYWPVIPGRVLPNAGAICSGGSNGNSGSQALCLAVQMGATRIVLLGFDHQHTRGYAHHHADYPAPMANAKNPEDWVNIMDALEPQIRHRGVLVINSTRETALTCFQQIPLELALA